MFGAIAGGIASALAGGAMSKLFGGGQKAASGGIQGDVLPMLCVTIFVILVVWFLLPRVARLMIHTPTAISIFVCLSMVQLMAVFISMRCTLCGHFLQVALTLILVVGY